MQGCKMKFLKDGDFVAKTNTVQETQGLLSELKEYLGCKTKNVECTNQASKQMTTCDRILRACIHRFGEGLDCPVHLESLQALAEIAHQGYIRSRLQYVPLYVERLLYHLMRNAAALGPSDTCLRFADFLYADLLKCHPPQVPADDYILIAKSAFSVLWKSTESMVKTEKMSTDFRIVLSTQLQAIRFLILLENEASNSTFQEPPFFTSVVARHASAAAVLFEGQRSPLKDEEARFLSQEIFRHLIAALLEKRGANEPLTSQDCLSIIELTVVRFRYLLKSNCFRDCREVFQQLRKTIQESQYNVVLEILSSGIELNRILALYEGSVGPFYTQAAVSLKSLLNSPVPLLRLLTESCQLFMTPLYGHANKSKQGLFSLQDILDISSFLESFFKLFGKLLDASPDNMKQHQALKKLLFHCFQLYTTVVYDTLQTLQELESTAGLPTLLLYLQKTVTNMLSTLEDLSEREQAEFLDVLAYCVSRLAYSFYCHKMYIEANTIVKPFCSWIAKKELDRCPHLPIEKIHNCFKLQVENYRKLGLLDEALQAVILWLAAQRSKITEQMAEPISSWVKIKMDANKNGADDLRLKTLKEGLEGCNLDAEVLIKVLFEELKAYKTVRVDTGQERFNVICDLLDICSEGSSWIHERAVILVELAQVLCYHDYSEQTDCSALDSIDEALRLLDSVPKTSQNEEQLQDEKAQALLWLYICTIEEKMHESIKQEQRTRNSQAQKPRDLEGFETNDLGYENKTQDDKFLYLGIAFNLTADLAQSKCLDDALGFWKQLLSKGRIPVVRCLEQTTASLHIMAALYRIMGKPLQALESYFLIAELGDLLGDSVGKTSALCQIARLFLQLECPGYAEAMLMEAESYLHSKDKNHDSYLLFNQTLAVLRSKLCLANLKIEEGIIQLIEVLQNPALQKPSKVWYLLRAITLQLTASYLSLSASILPKALRQKLCAQGWKTSEMALSDAHKLYRSILLNFSLISSDVSTKDVPEHQFVDHGDNLVQKWQVLADMFVCSEAFVSLLCKIEIVSEAKAFCLETLKISMRLQSIRWCARFLVLKSELELQRSDLDLCHSDLEQVLFLLESSTVFERNEEKRNLKIKPKKAGRKAKKPEGQDLESSEEQSFLREVSLEFVDTSHLQNENSLTSSPVLRSKQKKHPIFLSHPDKCPCLLCSDVVLSAVCLCWLVTSAERELANGNRVAGLCLLEATLKRCTTVALRISSMVASISQRTGKKTIVQHQSTAGLFGDLVARIYVALAKQSIKTSRLEKKFWKILETGLALYSSKDSKLHSLEYQKAGLLLIKAIATVSILASSQDGSVENVFSSAWSWKLPFSPSGNQENQENKPAAGEEKILDDNSTMSLKSKKQKQPNTNKKAKAKNIQKTKQLPKINSNDSFAMVDSVVLPVVPRTPVEHCTPAQKSLPVSKMSLHSTAKPNRSIKPSFVVFEESSPKVKIDLPKAPRVSKRTKSRIKMVFSDGSDVENPSEASQEPQFLVARDQAVAAPKSGRRATSNKKPSKMKSTKIEQCTVGSSRDSVQAEGKLQSGRKATRRGKKEEKIPKVHIERRTGNTQNDQEQEDKELLRTTEESVEPSFEFIRGSDEEVVQGSRRWPSPPNITEEDQEVLRRDISGESQGVFFSAEEKGLEDSFSLHTFASSLDVPASCFSIDLVYDSLLAAFCSISHYPPATLYHRLCQFMALCIGSQDPIATAYLVSESVSVTLRHQMMTAIHKKLNKMKKASVASASKQLEALSLEEENNSQFQHLSEVQNLFAFSSPSQAELETENFKEQLQQIPHGVTICILTLVSIQPEAVGDNILLTRLEKGGTPVTIQIQTANSKMPLSAALREFDTILQKQKEISNLTEKEDWWAGRIALDKRMKALTESLELHVLSCWRGILLPVHEDKNLKEEVSHLQAHLKECGCGTVELGLLKSILIGSHLLTPQHVWCLAQGFKPSQPDRAQSLLQEAVDKMGARTGQMPSGHLILILDKHLQKLPWENMPYLRNQTVTRLPSLHFLLSSMLTKKYQNNAILNHGINSSSIFYVLNPHKNLPGTEKIFKDWFQSEPGWTGVVGETPSADQVPLALEERDLYIYAGHGAGARFMDSILKMDCRAVALLFGCSSAALVVQGELEGAGAILKFVMAGCPLVLGNLWDVTDRDIDRYMEALLKNWFKAGPGAPLLQYVIQSRQAPKLKYMIGAAPIAYGLPVSLQ